MFLNASTRQSFQCDFPNTSLPLSQPHVNSELGSSRVAPEAEAANQKVAHPQNTYAIIRYRGI